MTKFVGLEIPDELLAQPGQIRRAPSVNDFAPTAKRFALADGPAYNLPIGAQAV